jgi:hypothetical protein
MSPADVPQLNRLRALLQKQLNVQSHVSDCIEQIAQTLVHARGAPHCERLSNILNHSEVGLRNARLNLVEHIEETRRSLKLAYELSLEKKSVSKSEPPSNARLPL